MRLAITGVEGFVGRHVAALAAQAGHEVSGLTRTPLQDGDSLRRQLVDIQVADLTTDLPDVSQVEVIIHLAGLAAVGASFDAPREYIDGNSSMLIHLAESALRSGSNSPRLVVVSTGAVYEGSPKPTDEMAALATSSPYVISKRTVEMLVDYYSARGLKGTIGRPFNHVGPGQRSGYLIPDLTAKLRVLPEGAVLQAGNLNSRRDYTDVRDVARAYLALAENPHPRHAIYNVASGRSLSGHEILRQICDAIGRPVPETSVDGRALRPSDTSEIIGDATRIRHEFGWEPRIPVADSVRDYVSRAASIS